MTSLRVVFFARADVTPFSGVGPSISDPGSLMGLISLDCGRVGETGGLAAAEASIFFHFVDGVLVAIGDGSGGL